MGQPPLIGGNFFDDPDEFDKLIEALGTPWRFAICEVQDECSTGTEPFDEADDEVQVLDDLAQRSLEELSPLLVSTSDTHKRRLAKVELTRLTAALWSLSIVGVEVFVAISALKALAAILTFFTVQFSRFLRGG